MDDIFIDLNFLTESERDMLQDVLARDDEFRRQEKKRLSELKKELEVTRKSNAIKASETTVNPNSKVCARCHQNFGILFNTGAFCPKCKARVCKSCRITFQSLWWLCSLCGKVRDVKAKSGAWFYDQVKSKSETRSLVGTSLIRASLKRRKTSSGKEFDDEMPTPPVIGLNHDNEKLHRPIPVHMSAIRESKPDDKENDGEDNDESMDSDVKTLTEVNQNYRSAYTKAMPVQHDFTNDGFSDEEEEDSSVESGHSTPTTQHSSPVKVIPNGNHNNEQFNSQNQTLEPSEPEQFHSMTDDKPPHHSDEEYKSLDTNGYYDNSPKHSAEFHSLDAEHTKQTKDHLHVDNEFRKYSSGSVADSVESFQTAEFTTPTETPPHSDFNTPTHSLPGSEDELDFIDARDNTPIPPERNEQYHSVKDDFQPAEYFERGSTDVIPPQIITTAVDDDPPAMNEEDTNEDIDEAFAAYGSDLPRRTLSDHFEMGSRESIVSYYSDAGEGHYGNIPITGEVQIGLKYDYRALKLEVQIHRARDIAPVDTKKNRSDPYVKVYLLPDKTKGGKRKTRTKKHTLSPEFDEILTFKIGFEEMLTRSLWLTVWNHDRFGHNDFLGEVIYPLNAYEQSGFSWDYPSSEWYPLRDRRPEPSLMEYCGEIVVALKYVPTESVKGKKGKKNKDKGELYVAMIEAHNLPAKDANGFSDPFCKTYLLPDKSKKTKRKTPTIKKNLNPVWNHTILYENLTLDGLKDQVLELTVWDWDRGSSNTFLGGIRLGMGARNDEWDDAEGEEIQAWLKVMHNLNEWNRFTLTLRSLSRFQSKPTGSDSDVTFHDEENLEAKVAEDDLKESFSEKSKNKDETEEQIEESKGIVNMAYSQTHGDEEEEKDVGSIFKTFNNFTSRFKFTSDHNIEDESNDATDSKQTTKTSGESLIASSESSSQENSTQADITCSSPKHTDESTTVPEVTTIVTEPEPSLTEKKSKVETEKQSNGRFYRRSTDNILFFEGATLSPDLDLRRRHSTDFVSVPKPTNEELVLEDLKKRGSPFRRRSTKKSHFKEQNRRESYSPRTERKHINTMMTNSPIDTRRKTLAELAIESGYKAPPKPDNVDGSINKDEFEDHEKIINASKSGNKSPSHVGISGDLYLTLEYCTENKTFHVHVHTANNLAAVDQKRQSSDPYVKAYLLPDKRSKRKTKTVRDNLNPQFDELIKYTIGYDELLTRTLSLTVWNDDLFGRNDFLGEVVIPIGEFVDKGHSLQPSVAKWYPLCEKTEHGMDIHPEVILALKYVTGDKVKRKGRKSLPSRGELQIQVLEAKNLPGKDADGMSDPFCKISLLPDKKGKTKHQTKKIDGTLNPVWNYKLSYEDFTTEELNERVLEITIWDHDMMSRDEFLGGVRLGSGESANEWDDSNDDESQIWHTMLNRTNVWIQVVIPLRPNMQSRKNT